MGYDTSMDITKHCKGCNKNFRESSRYGSGYCNSCRQKALKKNIGW